MTWAAQRLPEYSSGMGCRRCQSARRRGSRSSALIGERFAGADFFTTEVWTWRGFVTYYTVFAIDLASRRVQTSDPRRIPKAC